MPREILPTADRDNRWLPKTRPDSEREDIWRFYGVLDSLPDAELATRTEIRLSPNGASILIMFAQGIAGAVTRPAAWRNIHS